ncbi:MAG TPA: transglycosylase SLT domain-containing protein [Polyangia bacterium]|nr:transglycosylase SLT domain-containing protein [Polyangia bacterium]
MRGIFVGGLAIRYDPSTMPAAARTRRAIALAIALSFSAGSGAGARGAAPARAAGGPADPPDRSLAERRAVRGVAVDDDQAAAAMESPELREIRRFEQAAFPRLGSGAAAVGGDGDGVLPPSSLPGEWGGSGDVPAELRSPPPVAAEKPAPPPDSEWLRGLALPDLPVRWDAQVLRYLDYFKNDPKGHAIMAGWVRRAGRYRELFEKVLVREGLPKDLLYVAMVESGFDTGARSRVGAGGIWQFMPGAARAYGLEVSYWVDARRDPQRAVEAAARYLKDLYVRFGSWYLVFAAYNAGYGSVLRSITSYNTNDYWELTRHEAGLPWESTLYVPKILAAAIVGHNLAAFGFADVTADAPFAYEQVEVPPGTALATVARAAGTKPEVIEALNPDLIRGRTPPDRSTVSVRLPPGTASTYAASFDKTRDGDKVETVVLRFGETLDDVARAHGTTAKQLRRLNGVKDSVELRGGTAIVVPRRAIAKNDAAAPKGDVADKGDAKSKTDATAGADDAAAPNIERAAADPADTVLVAVPDRSFNYDGRERVFYRTRDGDGLDEVADVFGVRAEDLVEWNNLDPGAKLHPGMVLQVFVRKDFDPSGVMLLDPSRVRVVTLGSEEFLELETARRGKKRLMYTCKAGDTLTKLGRRYGLTPGDLARINRFSYNTELHDGDRIVVYSPTGEAAHEVTRGLTPSERRPERKIASAGAGRKEPEAKQPEGKQKTGRVATAKPSAGAKPAARPAAKAATPVAKATPHAAPAKKK